ncbi:MAG: membrane protease YdiL (CAAX protease family) [Patiriisocius sp.]|jgi:membrane protease YdiL (CAAX protease family)
MNNLLVKYYSTSTKTPNAIVKSLLYSLLFLLIYSFTIGDSISDYYRITSHKTIVDFIDYEIWISAIFIAPIIEEFLFRLALTKIKYLNLIWILPNVLFAILIYFKFFSFLFIPLGLFAFIIFLLYKQNFSLDKLYTKNIMFWVINSSFIFSFIHIVYLLNESLLFFEKALIVFVVFLPVGLTLASIRIRYGIIYSLLLHSLLNFFTILLNHVIY